MAQLAAPFFSAGACRETEHAGPRDRREPDKFGHEVQKTAQEEKPEEEPKEKEKQGVRKGREEVDAGDGDASTRKKKRKRGGADVENEEVEAFVTAVQALADYCDGHTGDCATVEGSRRRFRRRAVDWRKAVAASAVCTVPFVGECGPDAAGGTGATDAVRACAEAYLAAANTPACSARAEDAARAIAWHIRRLDACEACNACDGTSRAARGEVAAWCLNACRVEAFYALYGDQDLQKRCDLLQFVAPLWDVLVGECSLSLMTKARHCY